MSSIIKNIKNSTFGICKIQCINFHPSVLASQCLCKYSQGNCSICVGENDGEIATHIFNYHEGRTNKKVDDGNKEGQRASFQVVESSE